MSDTKISALPAASTPLTGSEVVPLNQSGVTSNVTVANLTAGRNITFNNTLPGYTATATAAGTTTLTSSSTYHQRFTGSSTQTIVLPAATTMAQGQGFVIDNDSSGALTLQDGSTASLGSVTPGMAAYIFCENNSTTAGSWSGYMFVPGAGPGGQVTWGTTGLSMGGQALTNVTTIGATTSTSLNLQSNGTTNAILDASGNLGLGVTPSAWLTVKAMQLGSYGQGIAGGTGQTGMYVGSNNYYGSGSWTYTTTAYATQYKQNESNSGSHAWMVAPSGTASNAITFTQAMTLDNSGNLLVGATANSAEGTRLYVLADGTHGTAEFSVPSTASYTQIFFRNPNGVVGSILTAASATSYVTSSDYRLKNTIEPMTAALDKVALLKPVTYKWNVDGSDGEGFIAHELAEVCPHAVVGEKDAVDSNGKPVYQGIDTSFLVATLTAAIQELSAQIVTLQARLKAANIA
jgi:hypothetical protein